MHGNSKGKARERSRDENNSNRRVKNMEKMNVGTKTESPKEGPTSAEVLAPIISNGRNFPSTVNQTKMTNLTYCLIYGP